LCPRGVGGDGGAAESLAFDDRSWLEELHKALEAQNASAGIAEAKPAVYAQVRHRNHVVMTPLTRSDLADSVWNWS
jgi:hypothetical protein